jgi:hypothetical protein
MVTFFIALLIFCYRISNPATRVSVSIASVFVAILIIWCIRTAWESTEGEDVWRDSVIVFRRARSKLFERVKKFNPFGIRRGPRHVSHFSHVSQVSHDDRITLADRMGRV